MAITLSDCEKILDAAHTRADEIGVAVSIAVVDGRGDLLALARMDEARHFTVDVARGKAMVSGLFGEPSGAFVEQAHLQAFQALNRLNLDRLIFFQGAVPLLQGSKLVGGVGVSGATAEQDEEIARVGAAAV